MHLGASKLYLFIIRVESCIIMSIFQPCELSVLPRKPDIETIEESVLSWYRKRTRSTLLDGWLQRTLTLRRMLAQSDSGRPLAKLALPNFARFCKILQIFCKFLAGSFSAVSKRNFARKCAFDSIFQTLQDLHTFAPLQSQNFRKKSV